MDAPIVTPSLLAQLRTPALPALSAAPVMPSMPQLSLPVTPLVMPAPSDARFNELGAALPSSGIRRNELGGYLPSDDTPDAVVAPRVPTAMDLDQKRVNDLHTQGSGIDQIHNPLLRGIARAGDITASVFGTMIPGVRALDASLPGTTLHHQVEINRAQANLAKDQATQKAADESEQAKAQTANLDLQPILRQQQAALAQEKQNEVENYHAATTGLNKGKLQSTLAQHGFTEDEANPGQIRPLKYEEMSPQQQAVTDLKSAQEEQAQATAALREAQNDPNSAAFRLAQQRVNVAAQNARTAIGRLGLSTAEFGFNQDKFYNPQPTAAERGKGDLAQSALERVQEMRQIIAKHPEAFGPVAGRATNAQQWLGSQDPDAQTYLSAAQYLADHSAGVFGGRGQYILSQLHSITDPHSNPAALNAALDEAERAAQGFVKAGTVHAKGGSSGYAGGASSGTIRALDPNGVLHEAPAGTPLPKGWKAQ